MSIKRDGDRYQARVSFTDRAAGKRIYKKRRFDKKKDAEAWVSQQKADDSRGVRFEPSRQPFGAVLDAWAENLPFTDRSSATVCAYRSVSKLRFDSIRRVPLAELTPGMLVRLIDRWRAEGLKPATMRQARMVLRMVLDAAVADALIQRNPLRDAKTTIGADDRAPTWSASDVRRFLNLTAGTEPHDLWVLLFATLLRIGELCALRWEDVDLAAGRLHVRRTWTKASNGRLLVGQGTKTAASARTIPLTPAVVALLRRMRMTRDFDDQGWVCWLNGQPARPDQVRAAWRKAVEATGLPYLTPHGARSAGATAMMAVGVSPAVARKLLGHKTATFTMEIYARLHVEDTVPGVIELGELYGISGDNCAQSAPDDENDGENVRRIRG